MQEHQIAEKSELAGRADFDRTKHRFPYIEWYLPDVSNRTSTCMMFVSGGGFFSCCDAARLQPAIDRFVRAGVTVVNLTYRTPRPKSLPIYQSAWVDAQRAVRVVRAHAKEYGLSFNHIGATGISAGAKAVLLLAVSSKTAAYERVDEIDDLPCRLSFAILQAPAYVLTDGAVGPNVNGGERAEIVPELKFDSGTAPLCCFQGGVDEYSPLGSVRLYQELTRRDIIAELHLFADRWHGFHGDANRGDNGTSWDHWCDYMLNFVSLFEPRIARKKRTCGLRRSEVIRSEIKSKGLPDVLICGKGEKELAAELIDGWLDRRKHGIQSDLHLFASEADEEIRSRCQLEFANHCQISIGK